MTPAFPRKAEEITAEWLSDMLAADVSSVQIEQIAIGVGLLGRLYRLALRSDGGPTTLIAKLATHDEPTRVNFVYPLDAYRKEVSFYRDVAPDSAIAVPRPYFAAYDEASRDFLIVMEDLGSRRMVDQATGCTLADAEAVIDALADHHAGWWGEDRLASIPWLDAWGDPPHPEVMTGVLEQALPRFLEHFDGHLPARFHDYAHTLPGIVGYFMEQASHPPRTYIHCDVRLENIFFPSAPDEPPVALVDWQFGAKGRGGWDLAYFLSQSIEPDLRKSHERELLERYRTRLATKGIDYPRDELWTD